jgi:hypothetical protein
VLNLLFATVVIFCPQGALETSSRANGLNVSFRMLKKEYFLGEPLAVELTISNTSDQRISLLASGIPLRDVDYSLVVSFDAAKCNLREPFSTIICKMQSHFIEPGMKVRDVFYLQSFLSGFEENRYYLPVRINTRVKKSGTSLHLYGATTLCFTINPNNRNSLNQIREKYLELYRNAQSSDEEFRAAQALAMMNDPDSLPYWVRALLIKQDNKGKFVRFRRDPISVSLIESLATNNTAISIVNESLGSNKPRMTHRELLTVLTIWKYRLPKDKMALFEGDNDPIVAELFKKYLDGLRKDAIETD